MIQIPTKVQVYDLIKTICYHLIALIITVYGIINKSVIYFLTAYITVIISILFSVGINLGEIKLENIFINLYDTAIISTILSTLVCFLVSLYYMINKPDKNSTFVTILWLLVIIAVFIFSITLIELYVGKIFFNASLKFNITYSLLFSSFILTIYIKSEKEGLKRKYSNQLISIKSRFMHESHYNGKSLKL